MSTPIQANSGVFFIGELLAKVEHIGGIVRGASVALSIVAKQDGEDLSCPMKITLLFVADHNSNRVVKRVFRRNALDSQITLTAPTTRS